MKTLSFAIISCFGGMEMPSANSDDNLPEIASEPKDSDGRSFFGAGFLEVPYVRDWDSLLRSVAGDESSHDFEPSSNIVSLGADKIAFCFSDVLSVWNVVECRELWQYRRPLKPFSSRSFDEAWQIAADPHGEFLYTAQADYQNISGEDTIDNNYSDFETSRGVAIWDVRSGEQIGHIEPDSRLKRLVSPKISTDGEFVVAPQVSFRRFGPRQEPDFVGIESAVVYSTATKSKLKTVVFDQTAGDERPRYGSGVFLSGDGSKIGFVTETGYCSEFSVDLYPTDSKGAKQRIVVPCRSYKNEDCSYQDIAVDPTGHFVATRHYADDGGEDYSGAFIALRDAKTFLEIRRWRVFGESVGNWSEMTFDQEGRRLAFTADAGTVVVNAITGKYVYQTWGERSAFARQGSLLVGFRGNCVSLTNSANGQVLGKMLSPLIPGASILFSAQCRLFASDSFIEKCCTFYVADGGGDAAVKAFFKRSNQPAKVYADLNGVRPDSMSNIDDNYRIPSASIVSAVAQDEKLLVKFEAESDARSELAEISVRVIESTDSAGHWILSDPLKLERHADETVELPLPPGKRMVTVELSATDEFGGRSVPEFLRVEVGQNNTVLESRLLTLSIGVSDYEIDDFDLLFASADATEIANQLRRLEGVSFGSVITKILVDGEASISGIRQAFHWLGSTCQNNDVVVIFISGHGLKGRRGLYYLPHEGDPESIQSTCLNWDELAELIGKLKAKSVICLSDVCHAGAFGESSLEMQAGSVKALQGRKNLIIGSSSRGNQFSLELDSLKHGAYASSLLEAFRGKADADDDGSITASELDAYCKERVKATTGGRQEPTFVYDAASDCSLRIRGSGHLPQRMVLKSESALMIGSERIAVAPLGSTFVVEKEQGDWSFGVVESGGVNAKGWVKTRDLDK